MFSPDFLSTLTFSPTLPAGTQSVILAHSVLGSSFASLLVLALWVLSSSRPQPSRSFRPTRLLAALPCLTSFPSPVFSPFPPSRSSTAGTQWVIPPHSVLDCPPPSLSRSFRPTRSLAFFTFLFLPRSSSLSSTALTQSVIPAHSVPGFLGTCFHFSFLGFLVFPLPPRLSLSFRPTRSLATSSLFPSSAFLSSFSF